MHGQPCEQQFLHQHSHTPSTTHAHTLTHSPTQESVQVSAVVDEDALDVGEAEPDVREAAI